MFMTHHIITHKCNNAMELCLTIEDEQALVGCFAHPVGASLLLPSCFLEGGVELQRTKSHYHRA